MGTQRASASPDQSLLALLNNNKTQAIRVLYDHYWKQLVCYAYTFLEDWDTSEEMVQELFIRIYVKDIVFDKACHLQGYLYRSVKNGISNYLRKQAIYHKHILMSNETPEISLQQIISSTESFDIKTKIRTAIDCIPEKSRVVYILNREHQMTIKQIAQQLNRPEDTVDKQLRRAVSFLKKQLVPLLA